MKMKSTLTSLSIAALLTSAAHATVTVSLIDTGAPKVPTTLSPTGFMDGYTGYVIRFTTDVDVIRGVDFGVANFGAITGTFAQRWTSSNADALSSGLGYDTPSPGPGTARNDTVSSANADSHLLASSAFVFSFQEDGVFSGPANTNPLAAANNNSAGFGIGSYLSGQMAFSSTSSTYDAAYLVVPNGANFSFLNAQVVVAPSSGNPVANFVSFPTNIAINGKWNSAAGGSWNSAANWLGNLLPHARGDSATFSLGGTITLDGDKTLSQLTISGHSSDIAQGTGGSLIFDAISHPAKMNVALTSFGLPSITAPVVLKSGVDISTLSDNPGRAIALLTFAGVISGDANAPLIINQGVSATFTAENTYKGETQIHGVLKIGDGGTTGSLGSGPVSLSVTNNGFYTSLDFNRSDTYVVNNDISGHIDYLVNRGPGTIVLAGHNTFSVYQKQILSGALIINGNSGGNAAAQNVLATSPGFSASTPTVTCLVAANQSFANIGASTADDLLTSATLRAGVASTPLQISLRYRTRTAPELTTLASDILDLSGMYISTTTKTDTFALEATYNASLLPNEAAAAAAGQLFLAWSDPAEALSPWVNAVNGNFGTGIVVMANYQGSWQQFASFNGITDTNVGLFLGSWGVDTASDTVWAVLNHNSQFAAATTPVPEPASLALLSLAALLLTKRRRPPA